MPPDPQSDSQNSPQEDGDATHDLRDSHGASIGNAGKIEQQFGDRYITNNYGAAPAQTNPNLPPDDPNAEPPFKGLLAFEVADAERFFGREALTEALLARLRPARTADPGEAGWRFLAIIGASGSGKSSAAKAGLVAALQGGALGHTAEPTSAAWQFHIITPTAQPLKALAASLTRDAESVTATAQLMDDLAREPRSLDLYAARLCAKSNHIAPRLFLLVDQFEELFTLCHDEAARAAFIANLMAASGDEANVCLVVLTLRADFYAQCAQYDALRERLARRQEFIGAMSQAELRRAIEQPAERGGWQFEPGLVDTLLDDAGDEPGALPLLSHALMETWRRREGRKLTLRGYRESGGLNGAIAKTADAVYQSLSDAEKAITRNVLLRLTALGEGTEDTRRRAGLDDTDPTRGGRSSRARGAADAGRCAAGDAGPRRSGGGARGADTRVGPTARLAKRRPRRAAAAAPTGGRCPRVGAAESGCGGVV
jgi:hypothetical protein